MYKEIKVVCIDIDGTLTDGVYQISESGEVTKSFNTKDFYAIEQLMRDGLKVVIITQSHDGVMGEQIKRIQGHSVFWSRMGREGNLLLWTAVMNKVTEIEELQRSENIAWNEIAYIGDAENDFDCISSAGFSGCPTDAVPYVRDKAMYPSDYRGGHGAVHDFCMYLLEQRIKENKNA